MTALHGNGSCSDMCELEYLFLPSSLYLTGSFVPPLVSPTLIMFPRCGHFMRISGQTLRQIYTGMAVEISFLNSIFSVALL